MLRLLKNAKTYLFIRERLRPVLLHLPDAQPPQRVLEEVGATSGVVARLLKLANIDEGSPAVDQVVMQPHPVLVRHLQVRRKV